MKEVFWTSKWFLAPCTFATMPANTPLYSEQEDGLHLAAKNAQREAVFTDGAVTTMRNRLKRALQQLTELQQAGSEVQNRF